MSKEAWVMMPRQHAQALLNDVNARIDQAHSTAVPVYAGIVALHDALATPSANTIPGVQWFAWPERKSWEEVRVELAFRDGAVCQASAADYEYWMWSADRRACDDVIAFRIIDEQPYPMNREDEVERLAQFLHDEGGFDDAMTGRTWPEHDGDTGLRGDGWVKIVPADVTAHFRDVARRWLLPRAFPADPVGDA